MESISVEMLHAYHFIDREIFARLVITCMRQPAEALLIMATWMWLEDIGYPNMIMKLVDFVNPAVVNSLADEAVRALNSLDPNALPIVPNARMPFTTIMMKKAISLDLFLHNKFTAISGIKSFLNTTCARIFTDILQFVVGNSDRINPTKPLAIPGFPHPIFGDVAIFPRAVDSGFPVGGLWGWDPMNNVSEVERTMFLTFSRGFPVTREEVTELFTTICGDNVATVQMQESSASNHQPLFAKMILRTIVAVDQILNGRRVAKFRINGKHIWARKYERRE